MVIKLMYYRATIIIVTCFIDGLCKIVSMGDVLAMQQEANHHRVKYTHARVLRNI